MTTSNGSPSSHLRNWRPGDDNADELLQQKIADALRDGKSERQIAKLLNIPRTKLWRGKKMAAIPEPLVDRLFEARVGVKAMLWIARYYEAGAAPPIEIEYCPHCGGELRVRDKNIRRAVEVMSQWVEDTARAERARARQENDL